MTEPVKLIAAIQGAPSTVIQGLFRTFVATIRPVARVVGVLEADVADPTSGDAQLCSLVDGRRYPVFQDLGPNSTACAVDAGSVVAACEAVRQDIVSGCDLVVLSKFGRLEAERTGLAAAFAAGVEVEAPILTSVAPKFDEQWAAFAAPLFTMLPPEEVAIRRWWRSVAPPITHRAQPG